MAPLIKVNSPDYGKLSPERQVAPVSFHPLFYHRDTAARERQEKAG